MVLTGILLSRMRQFARRRPGGDRRGPGAWLPIRWATAWEVIELMTVWLDVDGPLEAVGNTIAEFRRVDSQELAQRAIATVIRVFDDNLRWSRWMARYTIAATSATSGRTLDATVPITLPPRGRQ